MLAKATANGPRALVDNPSSVNPITPITVATMATRSQFVALAASENCRPFDDLEARPPSGG